MARRFMVQVARERRKSPTRSEAMLWDALRDRALGVRFYREEPIDPFIPDLRCKRPRLIIEIDGSVHEGQERADADRQGYLERDGYRVERFSAEEVETHLDRVVVRIREVLLEMKHQRRPK